MMYFNLIAVEKENIINNLNSKSKEEINNYLNLEMEEKIANKRKKKIANFFQNPYGKKTFKEFLELNIFYNFYSDEGKKYIYSLYKKKSNSGAIIEVMKYSYNFIGSLQQIDGNRGGFYNDILSLYNNNSKFKNIINMIIRDLIYSYKNINDEIYESLIHCIVELKYNELLILLESIFEITKCFDINSLFFCKNKIKSVLEKHKNNKLIQLHLLNILKKFSGKKKHIFYEITWELQINKYIEINKYNKVTNNNSEDIYSFVNTCMFNSGEIRTELRKNCDGEYYKYGYLLNMTPMCLFIIELQDKKMYENILKLLIDNYDSKIFPILCKCITAEYDTIVRYPRGESTIIPTNILNDNKKIQKIYNNLNKIIDINNNIAILRNICPKIIEYYNNFYDSKESKFKSNVNFQKDITVINSIMKNYDFIPYDCISENNYCSDNVENINNKDVELVFRKFMFDNIYNSNINDAKILKDIIEENDNYLKEYCYVKPNNDEIKSKLNTITNSENKYK